jgi:hypothetical protein
MMPVALTKSLVERAMHAESPNISVTIRMTRRAAAAAISATVQVISVRR